MAITTPATAAECQTELDRWFAALQACSSGQSYSIDNRTLTRQDIATIKGEISFWKKQLRSFTMKEAGDEPGTHKVAKWSNY